MSGTHLVFAGDLILDEQDPDHWLSGIAPPLQRADIAIGHLEVPHSRHAFELHGDVPAPGADPTHLAALRRAGFTAVSLAGNHVGDCGEQGIADTLRGLDAVAVKYAGADADLSAARRPALLRQGQRCIALLSYNCVDPENCWATPQRAGCAFVRVDPAVGGSITPAAILEHIHAASLAAFTHDIAQARRQADYVVVALHKGLVHTPARLAPYERPLAHAAIDAGCDIVLGHHAHLIRGIELYCGKPIFHGLGNGCVVTRALSPEQSHPARAAWARERSKRFGFEPDPAYHLAPFHPQAINAMLGCVHIDATGRLQAGFVPIHVEAPGRPVLAHGVIRTRVIEYLEHITRVAHLPTLLWEQARVPADDTVWVL